MAKKPIKKEGKIKSTFAKAGQGVPGIIDVANKIWVLTVCFTLWGSAYVIYMYSVAGVPADLKKYLAGALLALGLMYLFVNLRSTKPSASVIE